MPGIYRIAYTTPATAAGLAIIGFSTGGANIGAHLLELRVVNTAATNGYIAILPEQGVGGSGQTQTNMPTGDLNAGASTQLQAQWGWTVQPGALTRANAIVAFVVPPIIGATVTITFQPGECWSRASSLLEIWNWSAYTNPIMHLNAKFEE